MIRLVLFFMLLAGPAWAQAVRVTSGEHDGFTRLVLQFPAAVDWQVGRTDDGYELRVAGARQSFDLAQAFDLIGRERLAALWADPESGALHIGVACACHALPFALDPETVVIDLRQGPAPEGWGFETGFDGSAKPPLGGKVPSRQNHPTRTADNAMPPAEWDWRDIALGGRWGTTGVAADTGEAVAVLPDTKLIGLKAALVGQFADAATQGLVDPVEKPLRTAGPQPDLPAMVEARLGLGIEARPALAPAPDVSALGLQCPGEERLAVQEWGDDRPIREQMADATSSLAGEFDRTQSAALHRATRFQLFLGFGAEARGLMRAFGGETADDPLWQTLSLVVDGGTDPDGPLRGMAGCDDPAALWATLADPALPVSEVNARALLRSFSALPAHLRMQLGPALAERFMAAGDRTTAQGLSDAMLRPSGSEDDRRALLMQVRLALEADDPATADALLVRLGADPGPFSTQIIISQVELAAMTGAPVSPATVTAIEALLREADAGTAPLLYRVLVLARALAGDYAAAFGGLSDSPETAGDLWRLLADIGPDADLVYHALGQDPVLQTVVDADSRRSLGKRLLDLGFPEAALFWVGQDDPLLAARAALLLGRPEEVMQVLGPADGEAARKLKAEALLQFDARAALPEFIALGDAETAERAARLAAAWPELARSGSEAWRTVAQSLSPAQTPLTALAKSRALAESADATRTAIGALLATVPMPQER